MAAVIGRTIGSRFDPQATTADLLRTSGRGSRDRAADLGTRLAGELLAEVTTSERGHQQPN